MTKQDIRQTAEAVDSGSHAPEVTSLREHLADLRAENARLEAELQRLAGVQLGGRVHQQLLLLRRGAPRERAPAR